MKLSFHVSKPGIWRLTVIVAVSTAAAFLTERAGLTSSQDRAQETARRAADIIQQRCLRCHGADKRSGLDLRSRESMLAGGTRGPAIIAGSAAQSLLVRALLGTDLPQMPPGGGLDQAEKETLAAWIDLGAPWPDAPVGLVREKAITAEQRGYWAFKTPVRPPPPAVSGTGWIRNPIDLFILAGLEASGLRPSPEADKVTLLRRVTFDLTGLPPTPAEIRAFISDKSSRAYESVIDRLLASRHYGERWGQHWLDVVRFGETNGFELDAERAQAWRYRDYVIDSLNADKPYDQFLCEQLAGDELFPKSFEARVATGFLRAGPQHVVSGNLDKAELRQEYLTETMSGLGSGILGLTIGCARCHDHKFDPILQSDFYKLQAFFAATENRSYANSTDLEKEGYKTAFSSYEAKLKPIKMEIKQIESPYEQRIKRTKREQLEPKYARALETPAASRTPEQKEDAGYAERMLEVKYEELLAIMPADVTARRAALRKRLHSLAFEEPSPLPQALAVGEQAGAPPATYLLRGGAVHSPVRAVKPQFPRVLLPENSGEEASLPSGTDQGGRRSALAAWITSAQNPLTARVMVNRLWHHHFGRGLVATANDFGRNGSGVSNQALLDWLTTEFTAAGWRLKSLHRLILMSSAYRQTSATDAAKSKLDPDNILLWRQNRRRLDAEAIRDSILSASGTLNAEMGGPSIRVPMEPEVVATIFTEFEPDNLWPVHPDPRQHARRSIYLLRKRNVRLPLLVAYDAPDLMSVCGARNVSVHSLQALTMLNSDFMQQQSRALAGRILREAKGETRRIGLLWDATLGRRPTTPEITYTRSFLRRQTRITGQRLAAREAVSSIDGIRESRAYAAAWIDLCLATLNLNEFVYVK